MKRNNNIYVIKAFLSSYDKYKVNRFINYYPEFYYLFLQNDYDFNYLD